MWSLRDISIGRKLMIVVMVSTTSALLLAGVGIVITDGRLYRENLERDLFGLSSIIAYNSTAALTFDDPGAAAQTLSALRARTHVMAACIYRPDGTMLARYTRDASSAAMNAGAACPPLGNTAESIAFAPDCIDVVRAIRLDRTRVGTLQLLYDLGEVAERTRLYAEIVIGFGLLASLGAWLLASALRRVITTPVSKLVLATTTVSQTGDYSIRAEKYSNDELGVLVDRFNEMLAGIHSRDENLTRAFLDRGEALRDAQSSRERFRFMAESMPQKIFTATPAGDFDYTNLQMTEYTGLSFERIHLAGWPAFVHPDDLAETMDAWQHSVLTGEPFHLQHRLLRADGVSCWHLSRAYAMRDAQGNISTWIGSDTDINEQKEKENELRRANEDLQQFAWSASHDLQEPVRNVAVFSDLVLKRYRDKLDPEGQRFLSFLAEGGRRLGMLISDLLAYTRAGVVEGDIPLTDAGAVLEHVLSDLSDTIREKSAIVTFDTLPAVYIGETHLQQLLQNIVSNALKYCESPNPCVHVSAARQGAATLFAVRDNGIGIEPEYKEKIFGVFKRLHRDDKYGGTGIGLAICLRVVESYGGRIWVESEPGSGSTFFFTVPDRRAATAAAQSSDG